MRTPTPRLAPLLALLLVLSFGLNTLPQVPDVGTQVGQKAPDFSLPTIQGGNERVTLYDQVEQHDVVVLYFFLAAS